MKIPVNLASRPFRKDRAVLVGSLAVCAVLVATLGFLISLAMADRVQYADLRGEVGKLNRNIQKVQIEQAKVDAVLHQPENAEVLERSVFLNALLVRKGISWTRIFADLEQILPYNVKIVQIRPVGQWDGGLAGHGPGLRKPRAGDRSAEGFRTIEDLLQPGSAERAGPHSIGTVVSLSHERGLCPEALSCRKSR